jgi:hypothetical protein
MEAASFSEILVPIYQTTWCHTPQQHHNPLFLNLSSQAMSFGMKSFFTTVYNFLCSKAIFFTIDFP